jgi:hypothetical protein
MMTTWTTRSRFSGASYVLCCTTGRGASANRLALNIGSGHVAAHILSEEFRRDPTLFALGEHPTAGKKSARLSLEPMTLNLRATFWKAKFDVDNPTACLVSY